MQSVWSASIATIVALAILISLGVWQLHRRAWKHAILADITRAEQSPPIPLTGTPPRFTKVVARGVWRPAVALYGVDVRESEDGRSHLGAQRLQILTRDGAAPLLVDQGWVPTEGAAPAPAQGPASVEGYVRAPDHPGLLSPDDDLASRHFYTLDPAAIGIALGASDAAPFTLIALGQATPGGPIPSQNLPRPPDNHLQYAFTWFGLAAALASVFGVWVTRKRVEPT
jgi:surfeit locus 1 family protein